MKADLRGKLIRFMIKNKIPYFDFDTDEDYLARIILYLLEKEGK